MSKQKIKKGDLVKIITGDERGKTGKVIIVKKSDSLIKVQGISLVTKHYKAKNKDEKSEIKIFERFIKISNVKLVNLTSK